MVPLGFRDRPNAIRESKGVSKIRKLVGLFQVMPVHDAPSTAELPDQTVISGILYVERDSQKGILIGKGGSMIKRIGMEARQDLEAMTNTQVHLDLRVKVLQNWRKDARLMQRLGYNVAADER